MFGSQALETAIGLALMFFVLATAASSVVEVGSRFTRLRAKGLQRALARIVSGEQHPPKTGDAKVDQVIKLATGRTRSAYMSAKSFADAVTELAAKVDTLKEPAFQPMLDKLDTLAREAKGDLTKLKAGLETWFDQTMLAAAETYKKYTSLVLLVVGLGLAVGLNASTVDVARDLWADPVKRDALVETAEKLTADPEAAKSLGCEKANELDTAECVLDKVDGVGLPIGWGSGDDNVWDNSADWWGRHLAGWILTALLVMLGAPFWFDLLTRLVALRSGQRPKPAPDDPGSSTTAVMALSGGAWGQAQADATDRPPEEDWLRKALNLNDPDWEAAAANRRALPPVDGASLQERITNVENMRDGLVAERQRRDADSLRRRIEHVEDLRTKLTAELQEATRSKWPWRRRRKRH